MSTITHLFNFLIFFIYNHYENKEIKKTLYMCANRHKIKIDEKNIACISSFLFL